MIKKGVSLLMALALCLTLLPASTLAAEALTTQTVERTAVTSAVRRSLAGCIMGRFLQFQSNTRPEGGALASRV